MADLPTAERDPPLPLKDRSAEESFSLDWAHGRIGLVQRAAQSALMAGCFFYLAQLNFIRPVSSPGLWFLLDVAGPMAFVGLGIWLTVLALDSIHALLSADCPCVIVSQDGITVSNIARTIAWADIDRVFVYRGRPQTFPVIWLTGDSRYYRRFWPFWRAESIGLHTGEPEETVARIRAHPGYRGERDDP